MTDESLRTSNDLIRWLKLLTLPTWVKAVLALIMLLILSDALELLDWGLHSRAKDAASSAVMILTSGLPVSLIGVALVFGDGGVRKLESPTQQVLRHGIPNATLWKTCHRVMATRAYGLCIGCLRLPYRAPTCSSCWHAAGPACMAPKRKGTCATAGRCGKKSLAIWVIRGLLNAQEALHDH